MPDIYDQKADITGLHEGKRTGSCRKAALRRAILAIDPKTGRDVVEARIYWPGNTAYACIWVHGAGLYGHGGGKAGGYGYDKASAALQAACDDAGVTLAHNIAGVGEQAMRDAVAAIARAVAGRRKFLLIETYP